VDTDDVKVVISQSQICLIYIKSGNMVRKSKVKSGKLSKKIGENRNFHSIDTVCAPVMRRNVCLYLF